MSLHLHCKRSKMFIKDDGDSHKEVRCPRDQTTVVPDWVKDDIGYKHGVKDGSIIDLTPPKPAAAPVAAKPKPAPTPKPAAPTTDDDSSGDEDGQVVVDDSCTVDDGDKSDTVEEEPKDTPPEKPTKPVKSNVPKGLQGGATTVVKTK